MAAQHTPIYLDYASTTPVDPRVALVMSNYLTLDGHYGNPASRSHKLGWQAEEAVDVARNQIASLVNADPREIIFTSGATESNNLAIKGAAMRYQSKGRHLITVSTEHKAVLDVMQYLQSVGFDVTYLKPQSNGLISLESLNAAIRQDTILVSVMHVNNELGVIHDIHAIATICRQRNILFHVDAAQSTGKVPIDLSAMPIDLMSFSAHKTYGPKGIGALFVRRRPRVHLDAQIHGGGHERGMRSGTLATHQIAGMGEAYRIAQHEMAENNQRIKQLGDQFWAGIKQTAGLRLNGDFEKRVAGYFNISFVDIDADHLMMALQGIAVSTGSACTSASIEPSHVLTALELPQEIALSSVRFSIGKYTTEDDIARTVQLINDTVPKLQQQSPRHKSSGTDVA